jgi:ankyrin repeat domain-containing protein 50
VSALHSVPDAISNLSRTIAVAIDQGVTQLRHDIATARTDEHRDKIIRWLSSTDPSSNHLAACKKHQPSTGEWFIKSAIMEEWKTTQNSLLWLHGIRQSSPIPAQKCKMLITFLAGCGKTILR